MSRTGWSNAKDGATAQSPIRRWLVDFLNFDETGEGTKLTFLFGASRAFLGTDPAVTGTHNRKDFTGVIFQKAVRRAVCHFRLTDELRPVKSGSRLRDHSKIDPGA